MASQERGGMRHITAQAPAMYTHICMKAFPRHSGD